MKLLEMPLETINLLNSLEIKEKLALKNEKINKLKKYYFSTQKNKLILKCFSLRYMKQQTLCMPLGISY